MTALIAQPPTSVLLSYPNLCLEAAVTRPITQLHLSR